MPKISKDTASAYGKMSSRKGTPNKATQHIKEAFSNLLEDNLAMLQADLNQLEPKDRLNFILNLSAYILPKLKSQDVQFNDVTLANRSELISKLMQIDDDKFNDVV